MFNGKRALVTGGSRGIGRDIVRKLSKEGAKVITLARDPTNLAKLKAELPNVQTIQVDLSDWDATRSALTGLEPVDFLVNNAASGGFATVESVSKELLSNQFDVNVKSVVNVTQAMLEGMKSRGKGAAIVNVSSLASQRVFPMIAAYGSTKAALDFLSNCMAMEFGPYNIRVNSVNPGIVYTDMGDAWDPNAAKKLLEMVPEGKWPTSEEVADAVVFLLSEKAVNINGTCLRLDGGLAHAGFGVPFEGL
ncbi:L-xylulose reductase-like [Pecten maximus]|uniref:L-xylulose reductase-like n=1 Tax=Pecten maximus TaxID=6579 RepID=UPI0014589AFF|nr:L-xylulose reductase-like [Pecten maximus]XP_033747113.1 L-xylulose reductase-like [Pecten maximus]